MLNNQECQERIHSGEIRGASVCRAQRRSRSEPAVWHCEESRPHFSPTALCWGSGPQQTICVAWRAGKGWNKNPPLLYLARDMQNCPLVDMDYFGRDLMSVFKFSLILSSYFPLPLLFSISHFKLCLPPFHYPIPLPTYSLTVLTRSCVLVRVFVCTGCLWFIVSAFRSELKSLENKWDRLIELRRQFT